MDRSAEATAANRLDGKVAGGNDGDVGADADASEKVEFLLLLAESLFPGRPSRDSREAGRREVVSAEGSSVGREATHQV